MESMVPLVIRGGKILAPRRDRLVSADVLVIDGTIAEVGPDLSYPDDAGVIDAAGRAVLPGLVNAHTHAHNNLARGTEDRWTLEEHVNHAPAQLATRSPDEQRISALVGAIEMLKTGCTSAFDLFSAIPAPTPEACDAVASAYLDVGMRAVLAPSVADLAFYTTIPGLVEILPTHLRAHARGLGGAPLERLRDLADGFVRRWDGAGRGRIRAAVAPSIPSQCSDEFLRACIRIAREHGVPLHTHLCESKVQAVSAFSRWGRTVTEQLAALDALDANFVGAHAVWLTESDINRLGQAGASVVHNPASNLRMGSGLAPITEMLHAGVNVGIGTDGAATSDNLSMFEAMRLATMLSRVRFPGRTDDWLGAEAGWHMATAAGWRILGELDRTGDISAGAKADVVLLSVDSIYVTPMNHALNSLVYCAPDACVDTVIVDGHVVVSHGEVVTVDEHKVRVQAQDAAERIGRANRGLWAAADEIAPYLTNACGDLLRAEFPVNRFAGPVLLTR